MTTLQDNYRSADNTFMTEGQLSRQLTDISEVEPQSRFQNNHLPEIPDNPKIGVMWYIIYTLKMTAILYITKGLYELNPEIEVLQVTALKALISLIILIVGLNFKLKHIMYDSIDPESKFALAFKSCQTCVSIFISYTAMKYFAVSTTGVVCSLVPLIACIFAALFLKEKLTFYTVFSVFIVLSCVMMIIFGATGEEAEAMGQNTYALVALCSQPFWLAGGVIAARKMKKNHPLAQTCYTNLLLAIVSLIGIACYDHLDLSIVYDLNAWSWVLISMAGLFTIFENTAKFMAFRYEEAAKLQKLAFLPNVWNFTIDLFKHTTFGGLQLAGFLLLFIFYSYELLRFYCCSQDVTKDEIDNDDSYARLDKEDLRKGLLKGTPNKSEVLDSGVDSPTAKDRVAFALN